MKITQASEQYAPLSPNEKMQFTFIPRRISDGDTIVGDFDKGHNIWQLDVSLRLRNIDCAETNSKDPRLAALGLAAKRFVENVIPLNKPILVYSYYAKRPTDEATLNEIADHGIQYVLEKEKFGRFPIDIELVDYQKPTYVESRRYLTGLLLQLNLAVPYLKPINRDLLIPRHLENYKKVFNG
jgi:hypothetical protein